jgi:hypothetical protein
LNFECAVLPPGSSNKAIPLEAAFKTILRFDLKAADSVFHMKVFPVPPYPVMKKTPPFWLLTASIICSKICCCSSKQQM